MLDNTNHSLNEGVDSSTKSTAITGQKPKRRGSLGRKLVQELIDSGIPYDHQHLLSYQYVSSQKAFELTGHKYSGWVVLYTDLQGRPYVHNGKSFWRLKPDAGQITEGKYRTISGAGNRPYFSPFLRTFGLKGNILGTSDLIITEGEKKTDSLVFNGFATIGLAGVWSWKDRRSIGMLPELEAINWSNRNVYILFDSDILTKDSVKQALEALSDVLTEKKAKVRIVTLPCDIDGTKNGADDFLVKYGKEALNKLLGIAADSHEKKKYIWKEEPVISHYIALTASIVFQNVYALNPKTGLHRWVGTKWEHIDREPQKALQKPLHYWLDKMNWVNRTKHHLASVREELTYRIEHTEWNPNHLMSFKNGTFNVNTQKFNKTHNREDYLIHSFPFNYDDNAKCPTWIKFLNESFDNDQGKIELLRAAFKWSIFPKNNKRKHLLEFIFDLSGEKGTGKGTTLEVLTAIAGGDEAIGSLRTNSINKPTTLFGLIGKKIALDFDASGHVKDAGQLNQIISNEPVEVKKLYLNESTQRLCVVVWRAYNDNPTTSGGGVEGLGRRLITFRFKNIPKVPNTNLLDELLNEIEGIFWWCWSLDDNQMVQNLKNRGNIADVAEANIESLLENQPVIQFIYDFADDVPITKNATELYTQFKSWCDDNGKHFMTQTRFGNEMKKMKAFVPKKKGVNGMEYKICKKSEIDLARHFGFGSNAELNPSTCKVDQPNPSSSNSPNGKEKEKLMNTLNSSNKKNSFKNKKDSIYIEKEKEETLQTVQPSIIDTPVPTGSAWDTNSDDDDEYWPKSLQ